MVGVLDGSVKCVFVLVLFVRCVVVVVIGVLFGLSICSLMLLVVGMVDLVVFLKLWLMNLMFILLFG